MVRCLSVMIFCFGGIALATPNAHGQDFLRKLEEVIRNKQEEKTNEAKSATTTDEDLPPPVGQPEPAKVKNPFAPPASPEPSMIPAVRPPQPPEEAVGEAKSSESSGIRIEPGTGGDTRGRSTIEAQPDRYLGLIVEEDRRGSYGLSVVEVSPNSPAWKAGFQLGDQVLGIEGFAIRDLDDFAERIFAASIGQPVRFLINRNGRNMDLIAVLQDRSIAERSGNTSLNPNFPRYEPLIAGKPYLGVLSADLSDSFRRSFSIRPFRGAAILDVETGSPAAIAGLFAGDCIVEVNGRVVQRSSDLEEIIGNAGINQVVTISYYRGQQLLQTEVRLEAQPGSEQLTQPPAATFNPGMDSNDYVRSLESEVADLRSQLDRTQKALQQLQSRLDRLEGRR